MAHANLKHTAMVAGLGMLGLAACSTPGIDYTARVPAGSLEAASYRTVGVERFDGPAGGWFAARFEEMLASATLDGARWFNAAYPGEMPEGVYEGVISVDWIDEYHEREIDRQCVEWDGSFDCERRADVLKHCVSFEVEVTVSPALFDARTGEIVWSGNYSGDAHDRDCETLGEVGTFRDGRWPVDGYRDRHRWGGFGRRYYGGYVVDGLIREAAGETLPAIRRAIAPYNRRAKAKLMTEAVDPVVAGDARFELAMEAAKKDNFLTACTLFEELATENPGAPAVTFNLGACAEAEGDFETAQLLYAEAAQSGFDLPAVLEDALKRIGQRRAGEQELEWLTGAPEGDEAAGS